MFAVWLMFVESLVSDPQPLTVTGIVTVQTWTRGPSPPETVREFPDTVAGIFGLRGPPQLTTAAVAANASPGGSVSTKLMPTCAGSPAAFVIVKVRVEFDPEETLDGLNDFVRTGVNTWTSAFPTRFRAGSPPKYQLPPSGRKLPVATFRYVPPGAGAAPQKLMLLCSFVSIR